MDYTLLINKAISQIGKLPSGRTFVLKDLYIGAEWNQLPNGVRRDLGRNFKNEVIRGHIPNVSYIGKADNNSSMYIKE